FYIANVSPSSTHAEECCMVTISTSLSSAFSARREWTPLEAALLNRTEAEERARGALEAARRLVPLLAEHRRRVDHAPRSARELLPEVRRAGLLSLTVPVALGGLGLWQDQAFVPHFQIIEMLAVGDSSVAQCIASHNGAVYNVISQGSPALRARIAREVVEEG